ncbi:ABC transporter substrate-binding protein [Roseibium limicola]
MTRRAFLKTWSLPGLGLAFALMSSALMGSAVHAEARNWQEVLDTARGQEVYFHAWGGEPGINAYISWAAEKVSAQYGVSVIQVKVSDTGNVVSQIIGEKAAGRETGGSVDLVWINGENFAALKRAGLLAPPGWATSLPNWANVDVENKPTVALDFTVPTEGQEAPWGMAQLVFIHDSARVETPPKTLAELASCAARNPGRISYPQPPNFLGSTFLKQVLISLIKEPSKLQQPVNEATFDEDVAPLFAYLDALHPNLWRKGAVFPQDSAQMRQLLADGELDLAFSFNPGDASSAIASGSLPETVRTYTFDGGTLGNTHFVAIPFNSSAKEGAMVFADFLMSAEAQAHKQDPSVWGDPTVLNVAALPAPQKALFDALDLGPATLSPDDLGQVLPEPHPSWVSQLEKAWLQRYSDS